MSDNTPAYRICKLFTQTLHMHLHFRSARSAQTRYHAVACHPHTAHGIAVNGYNHIARQQPHIRRRTVGQYLPNVSSVAFIMQHYAYALEVAAHHLAGAFGLAGRQIGAVRV